MTIEEVKERVPTEQEWLEERRTYIGSSEVYELLNQPQYAKGCARALAYRKLGAEPDFEIEEDDALMARGQILEPIAAALYEERTGRKVRRPPMDGNHARLRRHPLYKWAAAATDRVILASPGWSTGDLEIKTRNEGPYYRILRKDPYPYPGDLLQPMWSMFVSGHTWGSLAVLGVFGSLPMMHVDLPRQDDLMQTFERQGEEFAEQVWGKGEPPAPTFEVSDQRCKVCQFRLTCRGEQIDQDELAELRTMRKASRELVQIDNAALAHTLHDIDLMKQEKQSLEVSIDVASEQAMELLGDARGAIVRGFGKAYQMQTPAHYFDTQSLRRDKPELYEQYMKRRVQTQYLRLYANKERTNGSH